MWRDEEAAVAERQHSEPKSGRSAKLGLGQALEEATRRRGQGGHASQGPGGGNLCGAVHKGFRTLDTVPFVITAARIPDIAEVHIVKHDDVPNPNWLRPGIPSAGQQAFGDDLLRHHRFVAIPSAVSAHSWNLIFDPAKASGFYRLELQEPFALDTRLHPPAG
jgi:hypothetical protein